MYELASALYPINRSLTGDGVRASLAILRRHADIEVREVATGTPIFDWTVPKEWSVRSAHIKDAQGRTIVDFAESNLHVVGYSVPVSRRMPLSELRPHLHSLSGQPDLIPYRTAYWSETWGFCMQHERLERLEDGEYHVLIDSSLADGSMSYGEYLHKGESEDEFLLTSHICHPSLANDNCSGLALLALLAEHLKSCRTKFSYRFLFSPGTVGPIAWLARNEDRLARIKFGLVVTGVGDGGGPTYKRSRRGDAQIDQIAAHVLTHAFSAPQIMDFEPYGYDERQLCAPAFNLPAGLFQRSRFGTFPEYHTSADNLSFIAPEHLATSMDAIWRMIEIAETDYVPLNLSPKGEPQLGRRGLYAKTGGGKDGPSAVMAMLWVLNQADGTNSLFDIAQKASLPFSTVLEASRRLTGAGLIKEANGQKLAGS